MRIDIILAYEKSYGGWQRNVACTTKNFAESNARIRGDSVAYKGQDKTQLPAELDFPAFVKLMGVSDCSFLAAPRLSSTDSFRHVHGRYAGMEYYPYKQFYDMFAFRPGYLAANTRHSECLFK